MLVFINWLRGIAALLVFFFHMNLHIFNNYPATPVEYGSFTYWFVFGAYDLGKYAVAIFFMISGFLIPSTLRGPNARLRTYAIHRFLRLYPAYWLSILIFIPIVYLARPEVPLKLSTILVNFTMLQRFVGVNDFIGIFWTLQIELVFYGLCAMLFLVSRISRPIAWVIPYALLGALACAALRYHLGKQLPVALFIALTLMSLGDGLRGCMDGKYDFKKAMAWAAVIAVALIPICYLAYTGETLRYLVTYWAAMITFFAVFHFREAIARNVFSVRFGQILADCSYSVYLLQDPIGLTIGKKLYSSGCGMWLSSLCATAPLLIAAYLVFRFIEAPAIRLGKRITSKPK